MAMQKNEKPLAITIEQAGRMIGISRDLAYRMAKTGEIPTVKIGKRRLLVPMAKLEEMLNNS